MPSAPSDVPAPGRPRRAPRHPRRPGPEPAGGRAVASADTRGLIFAAAAAEFSREGYDGASVDRIAQAAGLTKAMVYYHFDGKLALYRAVVRDMLAAFGAAASAIAAGSDAPPRKVERFIETLALLRDERPWFPPLMLREMASGAPRLDAETLAHMKIVLGAFSAILDAGVRARVFRRVHPVMAYMTILGPLLMNAVRERAAAEPGRAHLPLFISIDRRELVAHMQLTALRMLAKDPSR